MNKKRVGRISRGVVETFYTSFIDVCHEFLLAHCFRKPNCKFAHFDSHGHAIAHLEFVCFVLGGIRDTAAHKKNVIKRADFLFRNASIEFLCILMDFFI